MAFSLIIVLLLLFGGAERGNMEEDRPSTRPATQPDSQPVERQVVCLRLLEPQAEVKELQWEARTINLSFAHLFQEMRVAVVDPTGRRFEVDAYNVFATAYKSDLTAANVRPAWPHETQINLAKRLEGQLHDWDIEIGEEVRRFLKELEAGGDEQVPRGALIRHHNIRLNEETWLSIRVQGVYGQGWFAVFDFSAAHWPE